MTKTKPFTLEKDGIIFTYAGRNASHEFFVGIKDGVCYHGTYGLEYIGPEGGCNCHSEAAALYDNGKEDAAVDVEILCDSKHWPTTFSYYEVSKDDANVYIGHS